MSLGSHGDDREVDRAQHLFCHGADEQPAKLAPAPSSEQHAVRMKLANRGCNLLCGMAFADQGIAANAETGGNFAPGMHHLLRNLQGAAGVVVGHAGGVGSKGRGGGEHVQKNDAGAGIAGACSRANGMRWSRSLRSVATRMVSGCVQRRASESRMAYTSYAQACHRRKSRDVPERTAKRDLNHIYAERCFCWGGAFNDHGASAHRRPRVTMREARVYKSKLIPI